LSPRPRRGSQTHAINSKNNSTHIKEIKNDLAMIKKLHMDGNGNCLLYKLHRVFIKAILKGDH